jgi:NADPH-dependent F420 reductase
MAVAEPRTIAILGGTGALGSGLAARLGHSGQTVIIGSRDERRAQDHAETIASRCGGKVEGAAYEEAARLAEIAILTVPYASQRDVLERVKKALAGKILIDATVPLVPPRVARVQLPDDDSAAVAAQKFLGEEVFVVSAFQNVSAHRLADVEQTVDCDVLVTGDRLAAREEVIALIEDCGLKGWHGGSLANSTAAEALTSLLIFINKHYQSDGAGIRITGA